MFFVRQTSPVPIYCKHVKRSLSIDCMETVRNFSISECFLVGWMRFKERPWFLMGVMLLIWGVAGFSAYLTEEVYRDIEPTRTILDLLSSLVYYWLLLGLIVVTLKLVDQQAVIWADMFVFDRRYFFYLLGTLLYGFVVGVGLVLLIIPGIYLALRYGFFWYGIIDGRQGVFDAFHESAEMTRGVKWQLILFTLACIGVTLLGLLSLGIGLLVAMPVTMLASAHLYRVLLKQSVDKVNAAAVPPTPPQSSMPQEVASPTTVPIANTAVTQSSRQQL